MHKFLALVPPRREIETSTIGNLLPALSAFSRLTCSVKPSIELTRKSERIDTRAVTTKRPTRLVVSDMFFDSSPASTNRSA